MIHEDFTRRVISRLKNLYDMIVRKNDTITFSMMPSFIRKKKRKSYVLRNVCRDI